MDLIKALYEELAELGVSDNIEKLHAASVYYLEEEETLTRQFIAVDPNYVPSFRIKLSVEGLYDVLHNELEKETGTGLKDCLDKMAEIEIVHNVKLECSDFPDNLIVVYKIGHDINELSKVDVLLGEFGTSLVAVNERVFNNLTAMEQVYIPQLLFKRILLDCIDLGGSDVHFMTIHNAKKEAEYPVRFRIGNDLVGYHRFTLTRAQQKSIIMSVVSKQSNANAADIDTPEGIQTSILDIYKDGEVDLRLTCNKVEEGYHCVARIQMKKTVSLTLNELGFTHEDVATLNQVVDKTTGLTLITGAIRSGKNTTAFAIGNEMVSRPIKIVDYSSPVEVYMPFVQVDYKGDLDILRNCMRAAKKQDVNVAFLNEIPNQEVAFAVRDLINSSIHVITTTHVDRIWHVFYKLKELYGADYRDIISQLNLVANQKMYKRLCPDCKEEYRTSQATGKQRRFLEEYGVDSFYMNKGCPSCANTLVRPVIEVIYFTNKMKSELLASERVDEMEDLLHGWVMDNQVSLEFKLSQMIKKGMLGLDTLNTIL